MMNRLKMMFWKFMIKRNLKALAKGNNETKIKVRQYLQQEVDAAALPNVAAINKELMDFYDRRCTIHG